MIRETGVIGDYRWGTTRKRAIVAWESSGSHASLMDSGRELTAKTRSAERPGTDL